MYHNGVIEGYPLQTYVSALLFSPTGSLVRQQFQHEEPNRIKIRPATRDSWSACLQTLEGHSNIVSSVAFSHDSARLASASRDSTVKIWDASSGACLQTLEGHRGAVLSVTFSHDSARLASASRDSTVKIWDATRGACLQTLEGHRGAVLSVTFSHDSARLASASDDSTVKIWDASSAACLQTLEGDIFDTNLSFNSTGSFLHTSVGTITLNVLEGSSRSDITKLEHLPYVATSLSPDSTWIEYAGKNMLWIPSDYRPFHSSVRGTVAGIGVGSGRVWFCSIVGESDS
jgi:WD40 repeat protein